MDFRRRWSRGSRRYFFRVRWYAGRVSLAGFLRAAWSEAWRLDRWSRCSLYRPFRFFTRPNDQHECYCPNGTTTYLDLDFGGLSFGVELSRSWVPWPCHCSKIMWVLYPEDHADDIEDYGAERLRAEYPNVAEAQEKRFLHWR